MGRIVEDRMKAVYRRRTFERIRERSLDDAAFSRLQELLLLDPEPNAQAALLIRLVQKYPDTIKPLSEI
jgi:hypothetical protein